MNTLELINYTITVVGVTLAIAGFVCTILYSMNYRRLRGLLRVIFFVLIVYAASDMVVMTAKIISGHIDANLDKLELFIESFLASLLMMLSTVLLLYIIDVEKVKRNILFGIAAFFWVVYVGTLIYAQFSSVIYFFDAEGVYHRGQYYAILLLPGVLLMTHNILVLFFQRHRIERRILVAFIAMISVPIVTMLIQMKFYGLHLTVLGATVSAQFLYRFLRLYIKDQYQQKDRENESLRTQIMISQMQPHFLFNSLNVIRSVYRSDREKGDAAIGEFTSYLRQNIDTLAETRPISFQKELEQVKRYLGFQKLRFGDDLTVQYEISCEDFNLPSLSVQPLVENAVSHGIRKSESGIGSVKISATEYSDRYEVAVIDDGVGFDSEEPLANDERTHIGIANVRKRLEQMCNGSLEITSSPGEGTMALITIPK